MITKRIVLLQYEHRFHLLKL